MFVVPLPPIQAYQLPCWAAYGTQLPTTPPVIVHFTGPSSNRPLGTIVPGGSGR